jgi:predicted esterase
MALKLLYNFFKRVIESDTELDEAWEKIEDETKTGKPSTSGNVDRGKTSLLDFLRKDQQHGKITYDAALLLCDCSYAESYDFQNTSVWTLEAKTDAKKQLVDKIRNWVELVKTPHMQTSENLSSSGLPKLGFACPAEIVSDKTVTTEPYVIIKGRTGAGNEADDMTCIVSERIVRGQHPCHTIIIAFHGSTSQDTKAYAAGFLSFLTYGFLGRPNDWAANFSSAAQMTNDLNIPENVYFHGGYLNNYRSVHNTLLKAMKTLLLNQNNSDITNKWIIFTGHSKGGGMATVAGTILTHHLKSEEKFKNFNFGILAFSSPRVFNGDDSRHWAQSTMGCFRTKASHNIIRISVNGDSVPLYPIATKHLSPFAYRHVGLVFLDTCENVLNRLAKRYQGISLDIEGWESEENFKCKSLLHYGHKFRGEFEMFDSNVVLPYDEWPTMKAYVSIARRTKINPYETF